MANLLLTEKCVRSCPYCFAGKHMSDSSSGKMISWEDLIYVVDLLEMAKERSISLLGGEPTLHPQFLEFVIYLLERNFQVRVFTSGIISNELLDTAFSVLHGIPADRFSFICNLNNPVQTHTPLAEVESVRRFLSALGSHTVASFNIYRIDFELDFLFQCVNEFGLRKDIRIGIAHPIVGKQNCYISPDDMDQIIDRLFSYVPVFERLRIRPSLDCGFPLCRFDDEQLGWLYRHTGGASRFGCGPIFDIGPDLTVWSCFPLSSFHKKTLYDFDSLHDVYRFYEHILKIVRVEAGGIYEECDECVFREDGICSGGCTAHILRRFQEEAIIRFPEVYS